MLNDHWLQGTEYKQTLVDRIINKYKKQLGIHAVCCVDFSIKLARVCIMLEEIYGGMLKLFKYA